MGADTGPGEGSGRRGELDVLRALVVIGLVFFHSALVFAPDDDFYVKNATTTDAVTVLAGFGVVWAMPMLFLVAGLGARHSVRRRGPARFARERLLRLGVPLVFGAAGWCWVLAILGPLDRPARAPRPARPGRTSPVLACTAGAALPLYVLHQPVVVAYAYGVVGWSAPAGVKYAVIVAASLATVVALYETVVRRWAVTRWLFGMRPAPRAVARPEDGPPPAPAP
ncbi:acyltransferase family protein [Streptomyces albogriseolus]|uniref:acyltransferase family protein n=1 Tax=Streptomyces albogriseolus TaxID=1887 RepID=UPI0036F7DD1C